MLPFVLMSAQNPCLLVKNQVFFSYINIKIGLIVEK